METAVRFRGSHENKMYECCYRITPYSTENIKTGGLINKDLRHSTPEAPLHIHKSMAGLEYYIDMDIAYRYIASL